MEWLSVLFDFDWRYFRALLFSDESVKGVVFILALDMRFKFSKMYKSIDGLTSRLASLELRQTEKLGQLEKRVGVLENPGGNNGSETVTG